MPVSTHTASALPEREELGAEAHMRPKHGSAVRRLRLHRFAIEVPLEDLACAALFAFFSMQGSIPEIAPSQALELTASPPTSLTVFGGIASQLLASGFIVALLLRRPGLMLDRLLSVRWAAPLALLAIGSSAWSLDPWLTFRRSVLFALAGLFGLYFASRFSPARQLTILRMALAAVSLASVAMVVLAPSIGLDHSPGHTADWQGAFTQKNACGRAMVLGIAAVLFGNCLMLRRFLGLALFTFVLVMSGSRAAWLTAAALLLFWVTLQIATHTPSRQRAIAAIAGPVLLLAAGGAALLFLPQLARWMGRNTTLSGRTAIWAQVAHFIRLRPLLGYGYEGFWQGRVGPSLQIGAALRFLALHAHNGFLEILLELGAAGLALFCVSWLRAARLAWPLWRRGMVQPIAFPLAMLVLIVLCSLDENTLLLHNGIFWPLYVAALASIEQQRRDPHHSTAFKPREMLGLQQEEAAAPEESALASP